MAYKYVVNKACANRAAMVAEIHTQLVAMGWTYVDGIVDNPALSIPYTDVHVVNNTFTKVGHTLVNGTPVQVTTTTTIPSGLAVNTLYYVVEVSGDTFKLATTYGGTAINITAQGVGSHSVVEAFRIYSSNGEAADQITSYQVISQLVTNGFAGKSCYKYDVATRTYSGLCSQALALTTSETGCYLWIHGNKNIVHIGTKAVSTYYRSFFGFLKPFFSLTTALTSAATLSANPVTLAVTSSVGFEVGNSYQIIGVLAEGRETVTVTAIGTGTITIAALVASYGIGARIGLRPCLFGCGATTNFGSINPSNVTGTSSTATYGFSAINYALAITSCDPDYRTQKYILQPLLMESMIDATSSSLYSVEGYIDENLLISPSVGMVIEDTFAIGKLDSGTSSGTNNTTSVMNDTSKSWTIDAYIGKVIVITFGAGSGMIKKIISNTATALTIHADYLFETLPDNTSQYIICDEGYRYFAAGTGVGTTPVLALREGI